MLGTDVVVDVDHQGRNRARPIHFEDSSDKFLIMCVNPIPRHCDNIFLRPFVAPGDQRIVRRIGIDNDVRTEGFQVLVAVHPVLDKGDRLTGSGPPDPEVVDLDDVSPKEMVHQVFESSRPRAVLVRHPFPVATPTNRHGSPKDCDPKRWVFLGVLDPLFYYVHDPLDDAVAHRRHIQDGPPKVRRSESLFQNFFEFRGGLRVSQFLDHVRGVQARC
mmetsp:Transcript_23215/g.51609  ORF Transcript_23215/g.51609 Transcript_23215/m.51609 type:complete len:217 (+) Transcript_23215:1268-1918(+)